MTLALLKFCKLCVLSMLSIFFRAQYLLNTIDIIFIIEARNLE